MLGGITGPIVAAAAFTAPAKLLEYFSFSIAGIITEPTAAPLAIAAPDTAAIIILVRTTTNDNPPLTLPITDIVKRINLSVIPPAFINSPASKKNGSATIIIESAPVLICWATTITDTSV